MKNNIFKDNIIKTKLLKHDVINDVLKYIENINYLIKKICHDYEVLGSYNAETLLLVIKSAQKVKDSLERIRLLNDSTLEALIIEYANDTQELCSAIYAKENDLYEKKKSAEQLLITYNRQYLNLNKEIDDVKLLTEIRYQFQKEINEFKTNVRLLEYSIDEYWTKMYSVLLENNHKNIQIQQSISEYIKKEIETKKFYFKEFTYA